MIKDIDKHLIERCLESHFAGGRIPMPSKAPDFFPEDGGVPREMMDGEIDKEGWVYWKMLPSTVSEQHVAEIEEDLPGPFPPLFRAYLTTRFVLAMGARLDGEAVNLPDLPSDAPFKDLEMYINGSEGLLGAGYIPFGDYGDGYGPLCFDTARRADDGDCPVVWFDHDLLVPLDDSDFQNREAIEPLARDLFTSFRDMWMTLFCRAS